MRMSFTFRFIPFLAAIVVALIALSLGNWQSRRAEEKQRLASEQTLQAALPALDMQLLNQGKAPAYFRSVQMTGSFIAQWPIYLDNRPYQGKAGFYLIMPFKLKDSEKTLLVMRGWLPRDAQNRVQLPIIPTPEGELQLEGKVRESVGHVMQLGSEPVLQSGVIRQNFEVTELSKASGLKLENFIIEQTSDAKDGLIRDWPQPSLGIEKHRGYAFQWYGLAVTALLFFIATGIKRAS
ncbi:MAG: putative cytochrome c biosis [Pseudomonadota bacterium]